MTIIRDEELEGKSLKERYKYLNIRVKNENSTELFANLPENPTPIQKVFVTLVAKNLENSEVLIEQLKSNDVTIAMHALKAKWFYRGKNIPDVDFFMNEVFPFVSFHVMCKIVSRFGIYLENESLAEEFYTKVTSVYGYKHGIKFLPRCSEDFIHSIITVNRIYLDEAMLLKIYKKCPKQAIKYLELVIDDHISGKRIAQTQHNNVIALIAYDHPEIFIKLAEKLSRYTSINIGYRTSVKILQKYQNVVIQEFAKFSKILNTEAIIDMLKNDVFDNVFLQLMPEKSNHFNYNNSNISAYLKKYKPTYRATYICKMYLLKYKESIINHPSFKDWPVLNELPLNERMQYVNEILSNPQKPVDDSFYWKFYDTNQGIALYKDALNSASTCEKRTDILKDMIFCCKINNDTQTLLSIMKLVSERYKNDLEQLKIYFLNEIYKSFSMRTLSKSHWECIDEIIEITYLNKDINNSHTPYFIQLLYEEQIYYMLENHLDIEPKINKLVDLFGDVFALFVKHKKYARIIFDTCLKKYETLIENDSNIISKAEKIISVLNGFINYNNTHVEKLYITQCAWLISVIDEMFEKPNSETRFLPALLQKNLDTKKRYTNEIFKTCNSENFTKNLLIHNSEFLLSNIDKFTDDVSERYSIHKYMKIFDQIRTYFPSCLTNLLVRNINNKVSTDTTSKKACKLIVARSNLLNENDCNALLMKYVPKITKIDLKTINKLEYEQVELICSNLKKINPPVSQELILSFAKDDYLKLVLSSMLSLAYKYPNIETQSFIAHLSKQPVSVKKHGIRLAYHICPPKTLPMFYKHLLDAEKNSSIKEVIFVRTFNLLIGKEDKEVHRNTWNVLKLFIKDIDMKLLNLCSYLTRTKDIKVEILSEYCEISWQTLHKLSKTNQTVIQSISTLASQLTSISDHLDDKFCAQLFAEYLVDVTESKQYDLQPFIIHYVMNAISVEKQQQRITDICKKFKPFIKTHWDERAQNKEFQCRTKVKTFVNKCCHYAITSDLKISPKNVLVNTRDMLATTLHRGASFDMIMNINITLEFIGALENELLMGIPKNEFKENDCFKKLLMNFTSRIGKLWNVVCSEYSMLVLPVFVECIETFANYFSDSDFVKIGICEGLLKYDFCDNTCFLLVLELIPDDFEKYLIIIEDIVKRGDISIKILCDRKFELLSTMYTLV